MPTRKQLEDSVQGLIVKQREVLDDDARPWPERQETFKALEADVKTALEQLAAVKGVGDLEALFAGGTQEQGVGGPAPTVAKSLGEQVVDSEQFKSILGAKGGKFSSGAIATKDLSVTGPVNPGVTPSTALPGVVDIRFRPRRVRGLLLGGTMDNAAVTYLVETSATNAAAAVAPGGLKPESALVLDSRIEPAKKIATTLTTVDEILEDLSFARSYIDGRLRTFVELTSEDQLLNGSGTGPNVLGLLNRTGLATPVSIAATGDSRTDATFRQITALRTTSFVDPDAIVMHPTDWMNIRLAKENGATGKYVAGGPHADFAGDTLWGLPVVTTPAIALGKTLIGAFGSAAQVLQRSGLTVEATNTNEDDFKHNRVTFRAEERLALAVYRPGAFGLVQPAAAA